MSLISDEVYNNLYWEEATIDKLQELTRGATVLDAEGIDFPTIDGVDLILKGTSGDCIVISFLAEAEEDQPLKIMWARVPTLEGV